MLPGRLYLAKDLRVMWPPRAETVLRSTEGLGAVVQYVFIIYSVVTPVLPSRHNCVEERKQ